MLSPTWIVLLIQFLSQSSSRGFKIDILNIRKSLKNIATFQRWTPWTDEVKPSHTYHKGMVSSALWVQKLIPK